MVVRKIIAIPYVRVAGKRTRFLVVEHAASGDWTFISGTCEAREPPKRCVIRELAEETNGEVRLQKLPKRTITFRFMGSGQRRVDVFFIPLSPRFRTKDEQELLESRYRGYFDNTTREIPENATIRFETMAQFLRRRNIWDFVRDEVMSRSEFHDLCSKL